jgi:predicted ArsR family transcriptional regulator
VTSGEIPSGDRSFETFAVLADPTRRRMYLCVHRAGRPLTRDEVAASVGATRKLAAFHLDKLVEAGLLRTRSQTPGLIRRVGRRPKVYEPTGQVQLSLPTRQYDLAADILVEAVHAESQAGAARAEDLARKVAAEHGRTLGEVVRGNPDAIPGVAPGPARPVLPASAVRDELDLVIAVLERRGFEPAREGPGLVRLHNCPFHPLAAKAPQLVCGINHAFLSGLLEGMELRTVEAVLIIEAVLAARLTPGVGACCVEFRTRAPVPADQA